MHVFLVTFTLTLNMRHGTAMTRLAIVHRICCKCVAFTTWTYGHFDTSAIQIFSTRFQKISEAFLKKWLLLDPFLCTLWSPGRLWIVWGVSGAYTNARNRRYALRQMRFILSLHAVSWYHQQTLLVAAISLSSKAVWRIFKAELQSSSACHL